MSSPLDALRRLSASALDLLLTRAQFASVELAQARVQWVRWIGLALGAAVLALLALMAASAALVLALWEHAGALTLVALAVLYTSGVLVVIRVLQRELREAPPLLSETLAELGSDRDALLGRMAAGEPRPDGGAP